MTTIEERPLAKKAAAYKEARARRAPVKKEALKAPAKKAPPKKAAAKKVAAKVEPPVDFKWAVRIRSKHTGETITLGVRYATEAEARAASGDDQVCHRCNSVDVVPTTQEYEPYARQMRRRYGRDPIERAIAEGDEVIAITRPRKRFVKEEVQVLSEEIAASIAAEKELLPMTPRKALKAKKL